MITILEGILQLNQYQQIWTMYRATSEALTHEKYLFLALAGPYATAGVNPPVLLAERIETIMSQENTSGFLFSTRAENRRLRNPANQHLRISCDSRSKMKAFWVSLRCGCEPASGHDVFLTWTLSFPPGGCRVRVTVLFCLVSCGVFCGVQTPVAWPPFRETACIPQLHSFWGHFPIGSTL